MNYLIHYTTPTGRHNAKQAQTMEEAEKVKQGRKVWAVTQWETINGTDTGKMLEYYPANR